MAPDKKQSRMEEEAEALAAEIVAKMGLTGKEYDSSKSVEQLAEENASPAFIVLIKAMNNPYVPVNFRVTAAIRVLDQRVGKPGQAPVAPKAPIEEVDMSNLSIEEIEQLDILLKKTKGKK